MAPTCAESSDEWTRDSDGEKAQEDRAYFVCREAPATTEKIVKTRP